MRPLFDNVQKKDVFLMASLRMIRVLLLMIMMIMVSIRTKKVYLLVTDPPCAIYTYCRIFPFATPPINMAITTYQCQFKTVLRVNFT